MEPGPFTIWSESGATADEIAVVRDGLHRFNFAATGLTEHHRITLFARDRAGAIKAGLLGYVWGGWFHITHLWVAEGFRGGGLGRQLLEMAEREASRVGTRGAFLSTFDFQAPEFYRRYGYQVYATMPDYPPGHTDYHMRKVF